MADYDDIRDEERWEERRQEARTGDYAPDNPDLAVENLPDTPKEALCINPACITTRLKLDLARVKLGIAEAQLENIRGLLAPERRRP